MCIHDQKDEGENLSAKKEISTTEIVRRDLSCAM